MWLEARSGSCVNFSRFFLNLWLLFSCLTYTVFGQCEYGLEPSCVWTHDPTSALRWRSKVSLDESPYVELTGCQKPDCGIGMIQSPWLSARDSDMTTTLEYKIYGTSKVFLRVNLKLEEEVAPRHLFSKAGNYAYGYPKEDEWSVGSLKIPATHTRYKLQIKAYTPYQEAMVAVKGINLDERVIITSTRSSSTTSTTTTTIKPATARTPPRSTRTSTTTTTAKPGDDEGERTSDDFDYFPDDDDYEDERRLQSLEVENFIGEEDLVKGYTTVVEPQICPYKR